MEKILQSNVLFLVLDNAVQHNSPVGGSGGGTRAVPQRTHPGAPSALPVRPEDHSREIR